MYIPYPDSRRKRAVPPAPGAPHRSSTCQAGPPRLESRHGCRHRRDRKCKPGAAQWLMRRNALDVRTRNIRALRRDSPARLGTLDVPPSAIRQRRQVSEASALTDRPPEDPLTRRSVPRGRRSEHHSRCRPAPSRHFVNLSTMWRHQFLSLDLRRGSVCSWCPLCSVVVYRRMGAPRSPDPAAGLPADCRRGRRPGHRSQSGDRSISPFHVPIRC